METLQEWDSDVEMWKTKKAIQKLGDFQGNDYVSLYIPPTEDLNQVMQYFDQDLL